MRFLLKYGLRTSPKLVLALCPAMPIGPPASPACPTRCAIALPGMFVRAAVRHMMTLDTRAWCRPIGTRIGRNIGGAISPSAAPGGSPDDNSVRTPQANPGLAQPKGTNAAPINTLGAR
jgi:hypothetical protein